MNFKQLIQIELGTFKFLHKRFASPYEVKILQRKVRMLIRACNAVPVKPITLAPVTRATQLKKAKRVTPSQMRRKARRAVLSDCGTDTNSETGSLLDFANEVLPSGTTFEVNSLAKFTLLDRNFNYKAPTTRAERMVMAKAELVHSRKMGRLAAQQQGLTVSEAKAHVGVLPLSKKCLKCSAPSHRCKLYHTKVKVPPHCTGHCALPGIYDTLEFYSSEADKCRKLIEGAEKRLHTLQLPSSKQLAVTYTVRFSQAHGSEKVKHCPRCDSGVSHYCPSDAPTWEQSVAQEKRKIYGAKKTLQELLQKKSQLSKRLSVMLEPEERAGGVPHSEGGSSSRQKPR